ncbi:hypothetical protein GYN17_08615, partial [Lactococcus piscium]|nr:hypothetical protein [Lactococcus paracarnosus]MCJ1984192.1 hypothetical protein [Lactococcus paracarnosus]MCJ1998261.1 hypothetical protein [Lactococcus paracarnosus]
MATEEQLVDLNNKVYGVDHNYKKNGDLYQNIDEGQTITVAGKKFQVISTSNDEQLGSA